MRHLGLALFLSIVAVGCSGSDDPPANTADTGSVADTGNGGTDTGAPIDDTGAPGDTGGEETISECLKTVPTSYDSPEYATNAAVELGMRDRMKALMDPMKESEADLTKSHTADALKGFYAAGTPSLKSISTTYFQARVDSYIDQFVAAQGKTYTPSNTPAEGGKYGSWIFNAYGVDLRQQIEKGSFAAAYYNHAVTLVSNKAALTEATVDRLIAIYGAHPSFPQADKDVPNPDTAVALYAKRRDDKTQSTGLYRSIKGSLIKAKAAIAAKCDKERDDALAAFLLDWEKVELATVLFYLNDVEKKLSADPPVAADQASALHGYGEAIAFIRGFRTVATKKITDAEIDELLATLGAPNEGNATSYKLITSTITELPKFVTVRNKIKAIYGFTDAEMAAFKTNY